MAAKRRENGMNGTTAVRRLSVQLQAVHRRLLLSEAQARSLGNDPYKLMAAAMGDPQLAWLHPLLKLIASIDEADDEGQLRDDASLANCRERVEGLLYPMGAQQSDFAGHYAGWVTRSPEIASLDRDLQRILAELPGPQRQ